VLFRSLFSNDLPLAITDVAYQNKLPPIGLVFRRDAFEAAGGFDANLSVLEDWDFYLRLLLQGDIDCIPDVLAHAHVRETADGPLANTANAEHRRTEQRLRNAYLRRDIKNGSLGLGLLTNPHDVETRERLRALLTATAQGSKGPRRVWRWLTGRRNEPR